MTACKQTHLLRKQLKKWAASPEWQLLVQYELLPLGKRPWYKSLVWKVGRLLRVARLSRKKYLLQRWQPGLKHAQATGRPLLFWSDFDNMAMQRDACKELQKVLQSHSDICPVLITRLADFAFYSRLQWLIEYVPGFSEEYAERKRRYLAWRYRDAAAFPLSEELTSSKDFNQFLNTVNK